MRCSSTTSLPLDVLGDDVLPPAGLVVDLLPVEPDHVDQQPLRQPVLPHHPGRPGPALVGQLQMTVALHVHEVVPLHPGHRLRDGRTALMQPLGDPGPERDDALLLELVDGAKVHLGRVDQVAHAVRLSFLRGCRRWPRSAPRSVGPVQD